MKMTSFAVIIAMPATFKHPVASIAVTRTEPFHAFRCTTYPFSGVHHATLSHLTSLSWLAQRETCHCRVLYSLSRMKRRFPDGKITKIILFRVVCSTASFFICSRTNADSPLVARFFFPPVGPDAELVDFCCFT